MTEAMLRDVQEKLQQKHKEAQKSLEDMRGYFEVLMNAARDLGELRNCGYTDDLTSAEKQLRVAFAQLAASQSVLEDYLRESSEVQRRLSEAAHEDDDEDDEDGGGEESRRQREAQKEERFLRKINSAAKQLARFPVLASEPEKEGADPKKHPLYAQFNAKLAGTECESTNEDGLLMMPKKINVICPLTRKVLVDPVTNPACGHTYSKAALQEWAHTEGGVVRCPVAGCSALLNPRALKPATAVTHELLRLQLRPTPEDLAQTMPDGTQRQHEDDQDVVDI